jgi:phosphoglucosamine mutase
MRDPLIREKLSAMTEALAGGGRILLRKSGTEPVIRIMAEAESDEECRRLIDELAATIRERGY